MDLILLILAGLYSVGAVLALVASIILEMQVRKYFRDPWIAVLIRCVYYTVFWLPSWQTLIVAFMSKKKRVAWLTKDMDPEDIVRLTKEAQQLQEQWEKKDEK